jgi:diadenylate cyclase
MEGAATMVGASDLLEETIRQLFSDISWPVLLRMAADVFLVCYLIYRLLLLVRGTRAWRILGGILIFVLALTVSSYLGLDTLHWVLDKFAILGPVALVILLLPELRQAIEGFGKIGFWPQRFGSLGIENRTEARTVEELVAAMVELSSQSVGALIVIEKGSPLDEIAANGVMLNAKVSAPLLGSIFYEGNPLHDGAVIVRGDLILAAACRLPLSESQRLDQNVHMRHRAAVGVTEQLDCISLVVSEERGTISVASEGRLRRLSSHQDLRDFLNQELRSESGPKKPHDQKKPVRRMLGVRR